LHAVAIELASEAQAESGVVVVPLLLHPPKAGAASGARRASQGQAKARRAESFIACPVTTALATPQRRAAHAALSCASPGIVLAPAFLAPRRESRIV